MPGCEDPVNTTDTKTKGRGNRGKEGPKGQPATLLFSSPTGQHSRLLRAANHLHPHCRLRDTPLTQCATLSCPQSGRPCLVDPAFSDDGDLSRSSCSASLQWLSNVAPSSSLVWSSPTCPDSGFVQQDPTNSGPSSLYQQMSSTRLNHSILSRHSCSGPESVRKSFQ